MIDAEAYCVIDAEAYEPCQDGEQREDQDDLQATGFLGAKEIDDAEDEGENHRTRCHRQARVEQCDIGAHADQGEGGLENECDPGAEAANCPHQRSHAAIEKKVHAAGARHGGAQFGDAQHGRDKKQGSKQVSQRYGGTSLAGGEPGEQEKAGTQCCAGGNGVDVEQ